MFLYVSPCCVCLFLFSFNLQCKLHIKSSPGCPSIHLLFAVMCPCHLCSSTQITNRSLKHIMFGCTWERPREYGLFVLLLGSECCHAWPAPNGKKLCAFYQSLLLLANTHLILEDLTCMCLEWTLQQDCSSDIRQNGCF